jgi:hypothetical protein
MNDEIAAAVNWWADQLRGPAKMDNGDAFGSAKDLPPVTEEQIEKFKASLTEKLPAYLGRYWNPEDPLCGSYFRTLSVDYDPCALLSDAADYAGIDAQGLRFPIKTVMWIDPGEVRVACGYGAADVVVWTAQA